MPKSYKNLLKIGILFLLVFVNVDIFASDSKEDPENYNFETGETVYIKGIVSKPELNGLFGEITGIMGDSGRYAVKVFRQPTLEYQNSVVPIEFFEETTVSLHSKNLVTTKFIKIVDKDQFTFECLNLFIQTGNIFAVTSLKRYIGIIIHIDAGGSIALFHNDFNKSWSFYNPTREELAKLKH